MIPSSAPPPRPWARPRPIWRKPSGAPARLRDRAPFDPGRLAEIDERLDAIVRLKRKYGETAAAVAAFRAEIAATLDRLERHDEVVAELEERVARAAEAAAKAALALGEARAAAASRLERQIQKELRGLGMEQARFRIGLRREPAAEGDLAAGGGGGAWAGAASMPPSSSSRPIPGEEPRPLAKVVSGGELSRTMLAVSSRAVRGGRGAHHGLRRGGRRNRGAGGRGGGAEARRDGPGPAGALRDPSGPHRRLRHHHLRVEKTASRATTRTTVAALDGAARVEELARMLGGERVTEATRRAARELFREARREGGRDG